MAKLKPIYDRVVVERTEAEETTRGGIVIPDSAREKQRRGTVVAVGPGKTLDGGQVVPPGVQVGDEVLFGLYGGMEVTVDGKEYLILQDSEILGVLAS